MTKTITKSMFIQAFDIRKGQFSYSGLSALYDHLEEVYDGGDDLDVISLCCDYSEDTIEYFEKEYCMGIEEIRANTVVIDVDKYTVIIIGF